MATGSQYLNGRVTVLGINASNSTEIITFTIPSAGTWTVDYFLTMGLVNGSSNCNAMLFDSSNVSVSNSQITPPYGWNTSTPFTANKTILITTTGPATFKLKGWGGNTSFPQGQTQYLVDGGGAGVVYVADPVTIAKGDRGVQGIQGVAGPKGEQGVVGPIGPKGDMGLTGAKGDRGAVGPNGGAGPQGNGGPIGPIGPHGIQGPKGDVGPQGIQGPRGTVNVTVQTRAPNSNEGLVGDIWYQI